MDNFTLSANEKSASRGRNEVLDFLRGHYLIAILVDHFYRFPSIFRYYNGMGNLWVSAAEGFVFISGMLVGRIHFPKIQTHGFKWVAKKLFFRGLKLHFVNILLTITYTYIGLFVGRWPKLGTGILEAPFHEILWKAVIFQYGYGWADLLMFYAMLLMLSPIVIYTIHKGFWWLVWIVSTSLWVYGLMVPGLQRFTGSYFPLVSWQLLFVYGIILGYFWSDVSKKYRALPKAATATLLTFFGATIWINYYALYGPGLQRFGLEMPETLVTKLELGPVRLLLFFLWFFSYYAIIHRLFPVLKRFLGWLYLTLGKNSLVTYVAQSVILFGWFYFPQNKISNTELWNAAFYVFVILLNWAIVKLVLWYNFLAKKNKKAV